MPDIHLASIARLRIAYISAMVLIILWLAAKQVFVQIILAQEVGVRALATSIHRQELRSQRLLRNALLLLGQTDHDRALTEMHKDVAAWEQAQKDYDTHPTWWASDERARLSGIHATYQDLDKALHSLLYLQEEKTWTDEHSRLLALYPHVLTIFTNEILYLRVLDSLFTDVNALADSRVTLAQVVNVLLFAAAIGTLLVEYFLVIRPVLYADPEQTLTPSIPITEKEEE